MGQVSWTEKASGNLQAIHEYISRDSLVYATRFIKSLIEATAKLKSMPRCGRIVPEFESHAFREVIYYGYRIVYRIANASEDVEILAVLHDSREIKKALRHEGYILL